MLQEDRWSALRSRDPRADGAFVYAVRTTGVYCRPSCAARPARPENVVFYDSVDDARAAGFRACLRCRPDGDDPRRERARAIVAACRALETEPAPTTEALADAAGLSVNQFGRRFKEHTGVTPQAYRRRALAERAREQLAEAPSVLDAAFDAGYRSSSRFYQGVGRELGMSPSEARRGAPDQDVTYVVRACSLGRVLVAWTAKGVCEVALGDTDEGLEGDLRRRMPHARLATAPPPPWVDDAVEAVDLGRVRDVPLDIQGTAFQERVWQALRDIPAGETRSYRQVAHALGAPDASRAVAGACAANTLAVLVPCHRVVRSDGSVSGYRWGVDRKRALLAREEPG